MVLQTYTTEHYIGSKEPARSYAISALAFHSDVIDITAIGPIAIIKHLHGAEPCNHNKNIAFDLHNLALELEYND